MALYFENSSMKRLGYTIFNLRLCNTTWKTLVGKSENRCHYKVHPKLLIKFHLMEHKQQKLEERDYNSYNVKY